MVLKYHFIPTNDFAKSPRRQIHINQAKGEAVMTEIVQKRNALLRELNDLKVKPRRNLEEEKHMAELKEQIRAMMQEIGRLNNEITFR